jgi:hypothetical protein
VINQSHDPTGQSAGFASDTELDEQRKAVVVDAFANEVGAIELEDQQKRHVEVAAGRWQAAKGSRWVPCMHVSAITRSPW